jgi:pimeloyl-ACP methyl ester carboxylesterase
MQSDTIAVPDGTLYYELRGAGPVLLVIPGGPAGKFTALAELLADRYTVVTYDCRGSSRSSHDGSPEELTVERHADDAHRLLEVVGAEPAHVLGTSGGAIYGLDLAARYPDRVDTLVAHEPPLSALLPDVSALRAGSTRIVVGVGDTSTPYRAPHALADELGLALVTFPGDHGGFESHPDAFAAKLDEVLAVWQPA